MEIHLHSTSDFPINQNFSQALHPLKLKGGSALGLRPLCGTYAGTTRTHVVHTELRSTRTKLHAHVLLSHLRLTLGS